MAVAQDFNSALARMRDIGASAKSGALSRVRIDVLENGALADTRELPAGVFRIGSRADCDLIVPDTKVAHLATLKVEKTAKGQWVVSLVPFVEGLILNGKAIPAFNPVTISSSTMLVSGATTLQIAPVRGFGSLGVAGFDSAVKTAGASVGKARESFENGPAGTVGNAAASLFSKIPARPVLLVAGALFLAALASSFWDVIRTPAGANGTTAALSEEPRIEDAGELVQTLRRQLQVADLSDHIKVRIEGKQVVLEGAIAERQEERYRAIVNAARRRTNIEIRSQVRPVASPGQMQIVGIALEPVAYIVLANGQRYQTGDTLPQDWQIESISAKNVVLSRNGLRETIPLDVR